MRYMMMIKTPEDGRPPSPALMEGMGKLSEEMLKKGILLASEGLLPSSQGMRIRCAGGKRSVTDGPFAEAKELIGGFAILRAGSKEEALALAQRAVDVHLAAGVTDFELEIRPLFDPPQAAPKP